MGRPTVPGRIATRPALPGLRGPWAVIVNQAVEVDGVEVTLLSYAVADDSIRVQGAIRVSGNHEARLSSLPELELRQVGDPIALPSLGTRAIPSPPLIWLTWAYALPGPEPRLLSARIDQLWFGYRTGARADIVIGPWLFDDIGARVDRLRQLAADDA